MRWTELGGGAWALEDDGGRRAHVGRYGRIHDVKVFCDGKGPRCDGGAACQHYHYRIVTAPSEGQSHAMGVLGLKAVKLEEVGEPERCGRGGCTLEADHKGPHWRPDHLDPWIG